MLYWKHISIFLFLSWFLAVGVSCSDGRSEEERRIDAEIENLTADIRDHIMRQDMDGLMPQAVLSLSDTQSAMHYHEPYHDIEKERAGEQLKILYERELELGARKLQITLLFLAIAAITAVSLIFHYRRDRNYRRILKQYHYALEKERWCRRQLEKHTADTRNRDNNERKQSKYSELFARLEELMNDRKLYRKQGLSRDDVAKLLGTNRTYLSDAISHYTRLSFVRYVNSYRLREAVEILSDGANDTPIKALEKELGFSSHTTFYRLFKEATGLPPSQFRNTTARAE